MQFFINQSFCYAFNIPYGNFGFIMYSHILKCMIFDLMGVFAKNERGYRLNAIKKRFFDRY